MKALRLAGKTHAHVILINIIKTQAPIYFMYMKNTVDTIIDILINLMTDSHVY